MEFKINKDNWEKVTLGEIVFEPKETAKDIIAEGFEHIVGLEHIVSGDVHLRNSFSNDTDTTFTKVFRAGDILFGRRRAYLKKAAQASFNGVCSGDITVMRANDKLDVRLLPFVIHNEKFFDYAVKHSAGGLSPRVKFKDLANYEFLLPPKDQQAELADLLWAMDEVIEKDLEVLERLEVLYNSQLKNIFIENSYNANEVSVKELGTVSTSGVDKKINSSEEIINLVNYMDVYGNKSKIIDSSLEFMKVSAKENQIKTFQVNKGDVLFTPSSETKDDIGHSCVVVEDLEKTLYSYHLVRLSFNDKYDIDLNFKRFMFNNPKVLNQFTLKSKGVTRMTLSLEDFYSTVTLMPKNNEQKDIALILDNSLKLIKELESKLQSSKALQKALINQMF
ncbi:restriction endonuclease subunit S [Empedobacter sp. 225-1]|uniref:restriction endonuclease subunit S n=1 Tax=Empedobacter sp. 225-1 TaxID=2746725 RepID=UPI00257644BF|nr:restriction endonuclease subunit S [Empedobacter sp. 225-1]MDM1523917.1 restriction endonuclease subunit S [Empedobacter sp. 225-1]